ncbi:MAG: hypothetical protein O2966_07820 [Proteobacteria bacterium]|nr:hypothetical protein [Pseudomonadota bacterium]
MTYLTAKIAFSAVTNPILLWLFKHGWADPARGNLPANQVAIGLILHDLGSKLTDPALQEQAQEIAQKVITENSRSVIKRPEKSTTVTRQLSCLVQQQSSCLVDAEIFTTVFA